MSDITLAFFIGVFWGIGLAICIADATGPHEPCARQYGTDTKDYALCVFEQKRK